MSRGAWAKPVKCERGNRCDCCRSCKLRINSANYRERKLERERRIE